MNIMTILGTRPEIIRLSQIVPKLDRFCARHVLVHTGQNYSALLKDLFFEKLGVRAPDYQLEAKGSIGEQVGKMFPEVEQLMNKERPDRVLILGDTNSGLSAILAKRLGIPVYHMEAGNRCHDDRVPEEVNRRIIDHCSDVLMPYTERSRYNLIQEGIPSDRICVTGNPIGEVIAHYRGQIESAAPIMDKLGIASKGYFLVTMHRAENVDVEARLVRLMEALAKLADEYGKPVIVSTHPRTKVRMKQFGITHDADQVRFLEPFPFFEFIHLEERALCVLSDSGTVQEECSMLKVPSVTLRDTTERPETLECGSSILSGVDPGRILSSVRVVLDRHIDWRVPAGYQDPCVSDVVVRLLMGIEPLSHQLRKAE